MSIKNFQLKIDSSNAASYYNSYKTALLYQLSEPITCSNGESIVYSLISATIPYTFYGMNKYNSMLDIKETINNVEKPVRSISIPFGNYDAITFAKTLVQLLNTAAAMPLITYSIGYNKINNKYIMKTNTANTKSLFLFGSGTNKDISCFSFLGLPKEDIEIDNEPIEGGMITMNDIYHLQIKSDLGSQNVITSDSVDNILEIVPITPSPLSFIFHSPQQPTKYLLTQNNLQTVKLELTDNKNRPLDLNLIPFIINIKIEIVKNNDYDIPTGFDPRKSASGDLDNNPSEQTALERIYEDPRIIDRPAPYNVNDYIEYQIIQQMLSELSKSKARKKK